MLLYAQKCILSDMNKTANLYARIEPDVKEQAENVLETLGISVSSAINMFYKQIILQQGIPTPPNGLKSASMRNSRKATMTC